jgi:hypothetical protein
MTDPLDQKIKNILEDLREAHKRSEKYYAKEVIPGEPVKPMDIYDMALAFESEKRMLIDLQLARSEKYPDWYSPEQVENLIKERDRLTRRIHAWQNRQFPSQTRD